VAIERSDAEVLRAGLEFLGENGERWIKGKLVAYEPGLGTRTPAQVCGEGAVRIGLWNSVGMPADDKEKDRLERILALLVQVAVEQFPDIRTLDDETVDIFPEFNDHPKVGFGDVRVVFEKAIAEAQDE
jgi:hypothetical protein